MWIVPIVFCVLAVSWNGQSRPLSQAITFTELLRLADADQVRDVTLAGHAISGHFKDGQPFTAFAPASDTTLVDRLWRKQATINAVPSVDPNARLVGQTTEGLLLAPLDPTLTLTWVRQVFVR